MWSQISSLHQKIAKTVSFLTPFDFMSPQLVVYSKVDKKVDVGERFTN